MLFLIFTSLILSIILATRRFLFASIKNALFLTNLNTGIEKQNSLSW